MIDSRIILSSYTLPTCRNFLLTGKEIRRSSLLICRRSVGWYSHVRPSLASLSKSTIGVFSDNGKLQFFLDRELVEVNAFTTVVVTRRSWCSCLFRLENSVAGRVVEIPFFYCGDLSPPDMASHLLVEMCSWINGPTGFDGLREYFAQKGTGLRHST